MFRISILIVRYHVTLRGHAMIFIDMMADGDGAGYMKLGKEPPQAMGYRK